MTMTSKFNYVTYDVNEKYLLIAFLRAADIPFNVSGYYFNSEGQEGYYIGMDLLPDQEKDVEEFLLLFNGPFDFSVETISECAILRDHISPGYISLLHEKIVDIADSLYNIGAGIIKSFKCEYAALYNFFGSDYFKKVIEDMQAIDNQLTSDCKVAELIASYNDRKEAVKK